MAALPNLAVVSFDMLTSICIVSGESRSQCAGQYFAKDAKSASAQHRVSIVLRLLDARLFPSSLTLRRCRLPFFFTLPLKLCSLLALSRQKLFTRNLCFFVSFLLSALRFPVLFCSTVRSFYTFLYFGALRCIGGFRFSLISFRPFPYLSGIFRLRFFDGALFSLTLLPCLMYFGALRCIGGFRFSLISFRPFPYLSGIFRLRFFNGASFSLTLLPCLSFRVIRVGRQLDLRVYGRPPTA